MDAQELNKKGKTSTTWVKHVYDVVDKFNNTVVRSTGEKPIDAIKMDQVTQNVKNMMQKNHWTHELNTDIY